MMPKRKRQPKVTQVFIRHFPAPILDRIKDHLKSKGISKPSKTDAIEFACTQYVEKFLSGQAEDGTQ